MATSRLARGPALEEKEFNLIQEIAKKEIHTQRELSQNTGLSLGMTNILLKRLVRKGYVKIRCLDWKRTQYLLTVKGLFEKSRKSYAYALHAIAQFRIIRSRIHETVRAEYDKGVRKVSVVAWPDHAEMIRSAVSELGLADLEVVWLETFKALGSTPGVALTATIEPQPEPKDGQRFVPLLDHEVLKFRFPA